MVATAGHGSGGITRSRDKSAYKDDGIQHVYCAGSAMPGNLLQEVRVPFIVGMLYWQTKRYRVHNV